VHDGYGISWLKNKHTNVLKRLISCLNSISKFQFNKMWFADFITMMKLMYTFWAKKMLQKYFYKRRPKHDLRNLSLLYDKGSLTKRRLWWTLLSNKRFECFHTQPIDQIWHPVTFFCFQDLNPSSLESFMRPGKP